MLPLPSLKGRSGSSFKNTSPAKLQNMANLEIKDLTFHYRKSHYTVFKDFNLTLSPGHIYGLLGANGTGKSTLLYLMAGLLTPQQGLASYGGTDIRLRKPSVLQDIFIVPDEFELPNVPLKDYIRLNSKLYPRFNEADMKTYLAVFGMTGDMQLGQLSLGQRKKIFMSFAMATHARVLLMDEPTNGLDIVSKEQFRQFITQGRSDESIFVVSTHQVKDIETVLDHILLLDKGRIIADTDAESIRHEGQIDLEQFYKNMLIRKEEEDEKP